MSQVPASDFAEPFDAEFLSRLERLHLASRRIFSGRLHALHVSRRLGTGLEFADHRPYAPGDDLRLLDWNLYARGERLYTKLFRQEEDHNLFFLVDSSASMAAEKQKWDCARRLAAALAYIGLYEMDRVYLCAFAEGLVMSRRALRGRRAVMEALHTLASLRAGGKTDMRRTARDFVGRFGALEGMVLIFSDGLDLDGTPPALDVLFRAGFEVLMLHVVTPAEANPSQLGEWRLADPEGGRPHTVHLTRRLLARYRQAFMEHSARLRRHLVSRRGAYVRVSSDTPLEELILRELRAGHLLG